MGLKEKIKEDNQKMQEEVFFNVILQTKTKPPICVKQNDKYFLTDEAGLMEIIMSNYNGTGLPSPEEFDGLVDFVVFNGHIKYEFGGVNFTPSLVSNKPSQAVMFDKETHMFISECEITDISESVPSGDHYETSDYLIYSTNRRMLQELPEDKLIDTEFCPATGDEVFIDGKWWNEYINNNNEYFYGR